MNIWYFFSSDNITCIISGRCAFYDCYAIKHVLPVYEGVKPGSGDF